MPPREGGLFFVDMDVEAVRWDDVKAVLRTMPPATLSDASQVVIRSPQTSVARLERIDIGSRTGVAVDGGRHGLERRVRAC